MSADIPGLVQTSLNLGILFTEQASIKASFCVCSSVDSQKEMLVEVFTEQYGHAPKIEAIHAGVECGIFAGKMPGLDCVSIGPDLTEIHTCREQLHIASVQRLWATVLETLKRMK